MADVNGTVLACAVAVQAMDASHWNIFRSAAAVCAYLQAKDPPFDFDLQDAREMRRVRFTQYGEQRFIRFVTVRSKSSRRTYVRAFRCDEHGEPMRGEKMRKVRLIDLPTHRGARKATKLDDERYTWN